MRRTLGLVFSYLWALATGLPIPLAFWYVLGRVTDRTDVMIVSIGGILYVAIAGTFLYLQMGHNRLAFQTAGAVVEIKTALDLITESERLEMRTFRESFEFHQNAKSLLGSSVGLLLAIYCFVRLLTVV
ncbi:hypothetical protein [Devosia sp. A16]|uniref:hypothetical protein n=1 Tax=Devosia sp. A16 TaxID=1736675 RepID=UPI0006D7D5FA|nr:hypothetical protein [Devosia sp. A16]